MNRKLLFGATTLLLMAFAACNPDEVIDDPVDPNNPNGTDTAEFATSTSEEDADYTWNTAHENTIYLNGSSISSTSTTVTIAGTTATITGCGNYRITGTLDNGQIRVNNTDGGIVRLIMDNVTASNSTTAPLFIAQGKKTVIILPAGTSSTFSDAASHDTLIDGSNSAIYSSDYLSFYGEGNLTVHGNYADGINGKDELIVKSGNITVTAVDDGIRGKDFVLVHGGVVQVTTTNGDGIISNDVTVGALGFISVEGGSVTVNSKGDALSTTGNINIYNGTFNLTSGGGSTVTPSATVSGKAIKGDDYVNIAGGTIVISASDDAINSNNIINISGGSITATTKSDGLCATNNVITSGGTINITSGGGSSVTASTTVSSKGIKSPTAVHLYDGNITLNCADDCIHSDNAVYIAGGTITAQSNDDGIHAEDSIVFDGGTTTISKSYEGVEAKYVVMNNGSAYVTATNDGFNVTAGTVSGGTESNDGSMLRINGGYINTNVTNGDGIDGNGNITMTNGVVVAHGPNGAPEVPLDYNGTFNISGGLVVASAPSTQMLEGLSTSSTQKSVKITFSSSNAANTLFHIQDASGNSLVTFKPSRAYLAMIFSSPQLVSGTTYSIYTGGSCTGTNDNGYYTGGTYSGGTLRKTFTCTSTVTSVTVN